MKDRAKQIAKYYNQCKLPKWATVLGIVLLAFGIVAAGVTAIFHDKYSSIFGAWESALTSVWFIAFIALVGVGALISLGYPLLTLIGAWIWTLFAKPEPEVAEEHPAPEKPEVKEEASVPFAVNIKGTQFQENVSALVSEIDIRYPLMANDLRRHLSQYSGNPIQHQESIDTIIDYLIEVEGRFANRPRKIFISHKSEDSAFATELIKLLRLYIGLDPSLIFCSSVPGYEIDLGKKFFSEIKKQFDENEVLVIIIHSPRYYQSSICLNEMGAAWIMDAEHYSFLTADCVFSQLKGVIEDKEIAIKVNASDAKSRMNAFLQKGLQFLGMPECDYTDHRVLSRWEDDRDAFLSAVSKI